MYQQSVFSEKHRQTAAKNRFYFLTGRSFLIFFQNHLSLLPASSAVSAAAAAGMSVSQIPVFFPQDPYAVCADDPADDKCRHFLSSSTGTMNPPDTPQMPSPRRPSAETQPWRLSISSSRSPAGSSPLQPCTARRAGRRP